MLNEYGDLQCAWCGEGYLHHLEVHVFARRKEDGQTYRTAIDATAATVAFPQPVSCRENPSSRRSGVKILCSCELCHGITALTVAQHKGATQVESVRALPGHFAQTERRAESNSFSAPPY